MGGKFYQERNRKEAKPLQKPTKKGGRSKWEPTTKKKIYELAPHKKTWRDANYTEKERTM